MVVSLATIRQDLFSSLQTLLVANKPTYTYNLTTITYTITSAYPQDNPTFPLIVINKGLIEDQRITMNAATGEEMIEVQLDFYAKELHGTKAIDAGQDGAMNTIIGNISVFISTDGLIPMENFWTDSGIVPFQDKNQILNNSTSIMRFKLQ